jgi:hypothetical protein
MSQEMDEVISSAFDKVAFKVMDCEPFTILIEFMENGRKVTKCTLCLTLIYSANKKALGAKYLVSFSSRSLKTREKCISFAQLVLLSLYIF